MTTNELIVLISAGLVAGTFSGLLGIGGGIIVVPALVLLLGFSQHQAQGTSLFFMLFPIGLLGVMQYIKAGYVNYRFAVILAMAFFVGSYLGSKISITYISDKLLRQIFGFFFLLIGLKMVIGK